MTRSQVVIVGDGWPVCDCCAIWIANRDASGCQANDDHPSPLASFPGWPQLKADPTAHVVNEDTERDEISRLPCWGCASKLDGGRSTVAVLSNRPDLWV